MKSLTFQLRLLISIASTALAWMSLAVHAATCPGNLGASIVPTSDFVDHADGTVTHIATGLMWKQCNEGQYGLSCATGLATTFAWGDALLAAKNSSFAGYSDWRLPNKKELESLVDDTCWDPSINDMVFPNAAPTDTWTSTTAQGDTTLAYLVDFWVGFSRRTQKWNDGYVVRLVRGGQSFDALGTNTSLVSSVTASAVLDSPTVFTVLGTNLLSGLGFSLGDCTPRDSEVFDATTSDTLRKFRCTPRGSPGVKYGRVKTSPAGTTLANFQVNVQLPTATSYAHVLQFEGAVGNASVNQDVPISVTARDNDGFLVTGFNGIVGVTEQNGKTLGTKTLTFSGGRFDGNVRILQPGYSALTLSYAGPEGALAGGYSNEFLVTQTGARNTFTVNGVAIPGAQVSLSSSSIPLPLTTTTNADGKFTFTDVPLGVYNAQATRQGWSQVSVSGSLRVDQDRSISIQMKPWSQRRPVLFVPGVMGSTLKDSAFSIYGQPRSFSSITGPSLTQVAPAPKLPTTRCAVSGNCASRDLLTLYDPVVRPYVPGLYVGVDRTAMKSQYLKEEIEQSGFEFVPTPWDWRESITTAARVFLKAKIDEVKLRTGYAKVDVVAHSMGGLVTRAYVQSEEYASDIDRVIMVGTPNAGSTNAYFLMEGGDPLVLDSAVLSANGGFGERFAGIAFYTAAVNELHRSVVGPDLYGLSGAIQGFSQLYVKNFINTFAPGGRDLLPTYSFLSRQSAGACNSVNYYGGQFQDVSSLNPSLPGLNASANRFRMISLKNLSGTGVEPAVGQQVNTRLILSKSKHTLRGVGSLASGAADGPYSLGIPKCTLDAVGDGTVPWNEARSYFTDRVEGDFGSHPEMVGNSRNEVVAALCLGRTECPAAAPPIKPASLTVAASEGDQLVSLSVSAGFVPMLQAPNGSLSGIVGATGAIVEDIPASDIWSTSDGTNLNVASPAGGDYSLALAAVSELSGAVARVSVDFSGSSAGQSQDSVRVIVNGPSATVPVRVTGSPATLVTIADPVDPPTSVRTIREGVGSRVQWQAPASGPVQLYNVYARKLNATTFQLLGSTSTASFLSGIPWATSVEDTFEFVVLSVDSAAKESFIRNGNSTLNRSVVSAAIGVTTPLTNAATGTPLPFAVTFTDQSFTTAPVTAWAWDFDSDGVIDSTEQNPTFDFPAYGQFTVSLTVTTEDGVDTAIKPALVTVSPCAPLQQEATCSLDVNGDGLADSRDGLLILRRLLGFSGSALTDGVVNTSCSTPSTENTIADFVDNQIAGGHYNIDGSIGGDSAASSGLLIYRVLQGLTDDGVTANVVRPGATRTTWTGAGQIREYLNIQCDAGL